MAEDHGPSIAYYGDPGHSSMLLGPHLLDQGKYFVRVYTADSYTTTQLYDLKVMVRSERSYLPLALRRFKLNHPPLVPTNPQPPGGAADQSVNVNLKWTGGDPDGDSLTYDVFFEANDDTPDVLVCDNATSASCNPSTLSYETNYYWQIIARDSDGATTSGPVWSFRTQKPMAEVRAIWVTRFDWTSKSGHEGPEDIDEIVANVAYAGFNTILFQVRGTGDAYYRPGLEPWSRRLNNGEVLGQDPGWDPLGYMIEKAHARGIRVIVDLVINHTSNQHPWFQEALDARSERRDWYVWSDEPLGVGWHGTSGGAYYGLFSDKMPDLNYENPAVTDAMRDVARFWLEDMGVDGFRLDAAKHLIEDGLIIEHTPATHDWLEGFREFCQGINPDVFIEYVIIQGKCILLFPDVDTIQSNIIRDGHHHVVRDNGIPFPPFESLHPVVGFDSFENTI